MPDCTYCEETFPDDEAYLAHLGDAHRGELSRIDRRRVESFESGGGRPRAVLYGVVAVVVVLLAAAVYVTVFQGGDEGVTDWQSAEISGVESEPLPDRGDQSLLQDVEQFPSEGRSHVDPGTQVDYGTNPPTSGTHYPEWTDPGFYMETPESGYLVHSLEHGYVVIYYDPDALTPEAEASLRAFARNHRERFNAVVVAPNPNDDPESAYVLTAWTVMLRTDDYDAEQVRAFIAEYKGRGPEHPVR